jgi:dTDP-4-amino-4,6-dideoxygalactose transaminase
MAGTTEEVSTGRSSVADRKPAVIGGEPVFRVPLPMLKPNLPPYSCVADDFSRILSTGLITNGHFVGELEERVRDYLKIHHCIAISSCTAGMMLLFKAAHLTGEVVVASFTFTATVGALLWAGLEPVFADCRLDTFNVDPEDVERKISTRTSAILATHVFGNPADVDALEQIASSHGIKLFFDAAHGFGSLRDGRPVGSFGDGEIFSLSPTKLLIAAEGGIVVTKHPELATRIRWGRNYGNPGDYDCQLLGLSARMSELHAALALAGLEGVDDRVARRNRLAARYREELGQLPGISFQTVRNTDRSTYKDFTVAIDEEAFGLSRDIVAVALDAENVATRKYFFPPVHEQRFVGSYPHRADGLGVTETLSRRVLSLPMYSLLSEQELEKICEAIARIHHHAPAVRSACAS